MRAKGADGGWAYVLVLLEFQSSIDPTMALRANEYTVMLCRELLRAKVVEPGQLPPVLPVLLYNGDSRWSAALDVRDMIVETGPALAPYQPSQRIILLDERHAETDYVGELTKAMALLEQSNTQEEMFEQLGHLAQLMSRPGREELRRAFADWLRVLWGQRQNPDNPLPPPPELSLEEAKMTLQERVARWSEPWIEQGKREHGREQLRRLAEVRFGTPTAERLSALLQAEDDLQRLDALTVAVVRCETGDELLRQASNGKLDA